MLRMAKPKRPSELEEFKVSDSAMGYSRPVHLLRGPAGQPHRLCLFLDGELYLQKMKVLPVLNALLDRNALPPVTFAFLDHLNMKAREQDYTCNDQFGRFITVRRKIQEPIGECLCAEFDQYLSRGFSQARASL